MHYLGYIRMAGLGVALALLWGCASATMPARVPTETAAAIDSARAGGAEEWAPDALAAAIDQAAAARVAADKGEIDKALLLSARARADAELAQARALTVRTRIQIEQVRASTDSLRQVIGASVH